MRIIAKLDVKPPNVVKPVHFEGLRKIGSPAETALKFYEQGADEIVYMDIVSSLYRREILYDQIEKSAQDLFVPFSVGGGVRSIGDFVKLFRHGADKVIINTYAVQENPGIIDEAAKIFGSQAVVVNIEAKRARRANDTWTCYTDCGRIPSHKDVLAWVKEVEARGAGEIILQSVDHDGRQRGFDVELICQTVESVSIPVIAASGAGSMEHILEIAERAQPSAITLSSVLHYNTVTIQEVKNELARRDIEVKV